MAKFGLFLASFYTSISSLLLSFFSARIAYAIGAFAVSLAAMAALFVAFKAMVGYIALPAVFYPWYGQFLMAFFACWPSNAETCIAVCWGADVALFLYKYRVRMVMLVMK